MPARDLTEYERKRDFAQTPEPGSQGAGPASGPLVFVVHRHSARRLHFDLRLELGGVLLSWAVPRGPSAALGERRLAVRTEDHPLEYAGFEGLIPKGQYGAGPSLLWDTGTYSPDEPHYFFHDRMAAEDAVHAGLEAGKLSFTLRGARLKGSWALIRTKSDWLLIKHRDAAADPAVELTDNTTSAVSGRSEDELEEPWQLRDPGVPVHFSPASLTRAKPGEAAPLKPMLASTAKPVAAAGWSYEPKLDGVRIIATVDQGEVRLASRAGNDVTRGYPAVTTALAAQPAHSLILDGEIVAFDDRGRPSFEQLQQRMHLANESDVATAEREIPVVYYVFDVLHVDGWDVRSAPLWQRRALLERVLLPMSNLQQVATIALPAQEAFVTALELGFEGIIAKRDDSRYLAGKRSDSWRKRKGTNTGIFAVGGWANGEGARARTFGALLLGEPRPDGLLDYRGRVGTGFDDATLRDLRASLDELKSDENPFAGEVPDRRNVHWVDPQMDVVVEFAERTSAGQLRAPVYQGLAHATTAEASGGDAEAVLVQLETLKKSGTLNVGDTAIPVTNLDKEMWPPYKDRPAVTKRDLLRYALEAWPHAAPRLRNRLLTLTRFPNGITGKRFYQKHWDQNRPAFVETVRVYSEDAGKDQVYLLCNNLPTLLWLCQLANLEWHVGFARVSPYAGDAYSGSKNAVLESSLNRPDIVLFDLDPYIYRGDEKPGEEPQPSEGGFDAAKEAALLLKGLLDELSLPSFVKTSGATGLHIFVPVASTIDFDTARAIATTLANELVRRHPKLLTTEWASEKRGGKVFLDANQNARHKALAAAYSLRAHPGAPVSMPLGWDRLQETKLGSYHIGNAVEAANERQDPWRDMETRAVDVESLLGL